jgi:hypothetical protein
MKKFIAKKIITGVSKKFKGVQKIPAQKTPSRFTKVLSDTQVRANQRKVLGDIPEAMGLSSRSIGDLASDSVAQITGNKKFFSSLKTELKRSRHRTATGVKSIKKFKPVSKLSIKLTKSKGALKSYNRADAKGIMTERKTAEFLKGRFSQSSFSIKTAPAKKGFREGTKLRREGQRIIDQNKRIKREWGF